MIPTGGCICEKKAEVSLIGEEILKFDPSGFCIYLAVNLILEVLNYHVHQTGIYVIFPHCSKDEA